jgi:hypothetical protein
MWVDPLEIRNRPLHPYGMRHIKRCIPMVRPKGIHAQQKSYHHQNGPHLTIHPLPRRRSMKASHQFHICILWAGILDLEMTFYHWQQQAGIVNQAIILVEPAGSDIATLQQLSEIGAYENKELKPWLPILPFNR